MRNTGRCEVLVRGHICPRLGAGTNVCVNSNLLLLYDLSYNLTVHCKFMKKWFTDRWNNRSCDQLIIISTKKRGQWRHVRPFHTLHSFYNLTLMKTWWYWPQCGLKRTIKRNLVDLAPGVSTSFISIYMYCKFPLFHWDFLFTYFADDTKSWK